MASTQADDPHVGSVLAGQYRLESMLGQGGMGTVYRGVQLSINRPVAIKLISEEVAGSSEHVKRFRREAELMSKLEHPAIVRLYDFGLTDDGTLFLVMELLSGRDLSEELDECGSFAPQRALRICLRILNALRRPHAEEIIHRDLKPQNVFLTEIDGDSDFVKIMDFGLARLYDNSQQITKAGEVMGTPIYMAPEQAQGKPIDGRADIYAAGVILFVMLTGRAPFEGPTAMAILARHVTEAIPRLTDVAPDLVVGPRVQDLIDRLMAKDPFQRPATTSDAADLVHRTLTESASAAPAVVPPMTSPASKLGAGEASRIAEIARPSTPLPQHRAAAMTAPKSRRVALVAIAAAAVLLLVVILVSRGNGYTTNVADVVSADTTPITIASSPSGAVIFIDEQRVSTTPHRLAVRKPLQLELRLDGYYPGQLALEPGGDSNVIVKLEPLEDGTVRPAAVARTKTAGNSETIAPQKAPPATENSARQTKSATRVPGAPVPKKVRKAGSAKKPSTPLSAKERRERLRRKGPGFTNVAALKRAYREDKITREHYNDVLWVLKMYLKYKINAAKKRYRAGKLSKAKYKAAVTEAERFFHDGKRKR